MPYTDSQRIADLVSTHGITELADAVYEWLSVSLNEGDYSAVGPQMITDALRCYADQAR